MMKIRCQLILLYTKPNGFARMIKEINIRGDQMKKLTIAIDGPASSGKSSVAKRLAEVLDITYIDTGAMYRGVTFAALKNGIRPSDTEAIIQLLDKINLTFKWQDGQQVLFLNGQNINEEIRSQAVTEAVSEVSAIGQVRRKLVDLQRSMADQVSVVMDGRDIGTVVLPEADYKFFFVASPAVRALRRYKENVAKGMDQQSLEEIEASIIERDRYDSSREESPLKKASDAHELDTSEMDIGQVVAYLLQYMERN